MAFQVVVIIRNGLERRSALTAGKGWVECVEAKKMIERTHHGQVHYFFRQALNRIILVLFENIIRDLVGGVQLGPVNAAELGQIVFGGFPLSGKILIGDKIAKAVSIAHIAAKQRAQRVALQIRFIVGRE